MPVFGFEIGWITILLLFLLTLLIGVIMFLSRSGLFFTIRLRTIQPLPEVMPRKVAYILSQGSYKNTYYLVRQTQDLAPKLTSFAIFYDDPESVSCKSSVNFKTFLYKRERC